MKKETAPAVGNEGSLKRGVEHVTETAETLLRSTVEETGAAWQSARHALAVKARALGSGMSGRAHELAENALELGGKGQRLVRRHPWMSIAAGAGLGFLAGLLVRRR